MIHPSTFEPCAFDADADIDVWHVYPQFGKAHDTSGESMCWCYPVVEIQDNGNVVVIHSACH